MAPLLALDDPRHENATTKTAINARTPFFKELPLEIRIAIYEFVLIEDEPITPRQIALRSNKFECTLAPRAIIPPKEKKAPFASYLTKVCRQMYFDLETYPVFYRVNKFEFIAPMELLKFLAAITPQRRSFIRHIILRPQCDTMSWPYGSSSWMWDRRFVERERHIATLLAQCEDLRDFELHVRIQRRDAFSGSDSERDTKDILERVLRIATTQESDDFGLFNVPSLRLFLYSPDLNHTTNGVTVDLSAPRGSQVACIEAWHTRRAVGKLIDEVKKAIAASRGLQAEAGSRGSIKPSGFPARLHMALKASGIDFPGEERIQQDRFNNTTGTVSTRTRQKCSKDLVDDLGVIQTPRNKYDAEGLLTWQQFNVHGVRWNDSVIEFDVENPGYNGDEEDRSWEVVDAIITHAGKWTIVKHYNMFSSSLSWTDPIATFQKIRELPSPKDTALVIDGLLSDWRADNPGPFKRWAEGWKEAQIGYDLMLTRLEHAAHLAKGEATKKAKKAKKAERASRKRESVKSGKTGGRVTKRRR